MSKKFKVLYIGTTSKELVIEGPEDFGLGITIDYDDVDHPQVEKDARKLVRLLNLYWNAPRPLKPAPSRFNFGETEPRPEPPTLT